MLETRAPFGISTSTESAFFSRTPIAPPSQSMPQPSEGLPSPFTPQPPDAMNGSPTARKRTEMAAPYWPISAASG